MFKQEIENYNTLRQSYRLLPVKVSSFYQRKVKEELNGLGHKEGPLARIVYPTEDKVSVKLKSEFNDYVNDRKNMLVENNDAIIHKYEKTVLFLANTHCLSNCMYCFRQDLLQESDLSEDTYQKNLESNLNALINYIHTKPQLEEVVISGGDPLMLPAKQLELIFSKLSEVTNIKDFRMHSRNIVFGPNSLSPQHLDILAKFKVRLVFHIVHPYELCDEVINKIIDARKWGIRLYNQFPILRKINDHVDVLVRIVRALDDLNVRNLSIFYPDPVQFSSAFRIHFARLIQITDQFNRSTPSWINATRFCQDSVFGKVRLENLIEYKPEQGYALFRRGEQDILLPDHPVELDDPGQRETLLWKG